MNCPLKGRQKKKATSLTGQTPYLIGCLFCFQLYPFVVEEMNVIIDDVDSLLKGGRFELAESFFFEMAEEVLHRGIVPAIPPA